MFNHIFDNDSIHTQSSYEVELRVRTREEQRFMLGEDSGNEVNGQVKSTGNTAKAGLAGILAYPSVLLQTVVGALSG
jgi:hypothetical protein